jgi:tetratricopeptide (TPR) repeat protein
MLKLNFINAKKSLFMVLSLSFLLGCNYNYYRGRELESEGRYENANIEYQRAFTQSPGDDDFRQAYLRTAKLTSADLMKRYNNYLKAKKYDLAFRKLEQARVLAPKDGVIKAEQKKWFHILLAGRVRFYFKSLRKQIPLTERMELQIVFNTPNPEKRLVAKIDNQTQIFNVEEVFYEPPQNLLMYYTVNSVGVRLARTLDTASSSGSHAMLAGQLKKFIDFKTPILTEVKGLLQMRGENLQAIDKQYPYQLISQSNSDNFEVPSRGGRYSVNLNGKMVKINSTNGNINFLPQMLYINKLNQRIFLDFGNLEVSQDEKKQIWSFRRVVKQERDYLIDLKKSILLTPYFYFREGAFPFVKESSG